MSNLGLKIIFVFRGGKKVLAGPYFSKNKGRSCWKCGWLYVFIYIHIYIHTHTHTHTHVMLTCIHIYIYVCIYICIYIYIHIYIHAYTCIYIHVYIYINTCIHIYLQHGPIMLEMGQSPSTVAPTTTHTHTHTHTQTCIHVFFEGKTNHHKKKCHKKSGANYVRNGVTTFCCSCHSCIHAVLDYCFY